MKDGTTGLTAPTGLQLNREVTKSECHVREKSLV